MTDHRPPTCHHDRILGHRVTTEHRDDCPDPSTHRGCAPCTARHCVLCQRNHATNDQPLTCPDCLARVRTDLDDIRWYHLRLRTHAMFAGGNGHLLAAAPIPGGDAMVLMARAGASGDDLTWSATIDDDHRARDVVPTLLPLSMWDHQVRAWLGQDPPVRPSVTGVTRYLASRDVLDRWAQTSDGPDWVGFADDMTALRRQLEQVLHDEREPEQGVGCFECGRTLVRKHARPNPCTHSTPARRWLATVQTYPELPPFRDEVRAAAQPCGLCDQGGIADPTAGQSWECVGCRKQYTPGEYANAIRSDLLTSGPAGDGWTHITMAAEAATTLTGQLIPPGTVRRWMDRGKVTAVCQWTPGSVWGQRLVFWPDVADAAVEAVARALDLEQRRIERAEQKRRLRAAVDAGQDLAVAAKRLGVHPARVARFVDEWEAEAQAAARDAS